MGSSPAKNAQGVLELGQLDEEVVLGLHAWRALRGLEVEGEPLLDALNARPLGQIDEEEEVEDERCRQDRVRQRKLILSFIG